MKKFKSMADIEKERHERGEFKYLYELDKFDYNEFKQNVIEFRELLQRYIDGENVRIFAPDKNTFELWEFMTTLEYLIVHRCDLHDLTRIVLLGPYAWSRILVEAFEEDKDSRYKRKVTEKLIDIIDRVLIHGIFRSGSH